MNQYTIITKDMSPLGTSLGYEFDVYWPGKR